MQVEGYIMKSWSCSVAHSTRTLLREIIYRILQERDGSRGSVEAQYLNVAHDMRPDENTQYRSLNTPYYIKSIIL